MSRESYAATVMGWRRFLDALDEELAKAPGIERQAVELAAMYVRAQQLVNERNAHRAAMQAATRELQDTLRNGRVTATYLRKAVQVHLGLGSNTLVKFGITPSKSPFRRKKTAEPKD
jgi:uncharacterized protein (DUF1778 family)